MSISREVLAKYIRRDHTVFVECGSRWGDTLIRAIEAGAFQARGCESDGLYAAAGEAHVKELCPLGNATIYPISSVLLLASEPTCKGKDIVVFLDAHTETHSPVLDELAIISKWEEKPRAIIIDDMQLMKGWGIRVEDLYLKLQEMGYICHREDGVVCEDILVAQR